MKNCVIITSISIVLINPVAIPLLAKPLDLNGNGTADLVFISENKDETTSTGKLNWTAFDLATETEIPLGQFGQAGMIASMGFWTSRKEPQRLVVEQTILGEVNLVVDSSNDYFPLDPVHNEPLRLLLGRDLDGSGLADAITIIPRRRRLFWRVNFDPFGELTKRVVRFGAPNALPFTFRRRGSRDDLAFISRFKRRRARIDSRPINQRRNRSFRLPKSVSIDTQTLPIYWRMKRDERG